MKTVTIAGGGLAGLSLALGLRRRGIPVIVHEAGRYPRHRVCGEFISGVSAETLAGLGLDELLSDTLRQKSGRWFFQERRLLDFELPSAALAISRYRLDRRLRDAVVGTGGEVRENSRLPRIPCPGRIWAAGRVPRPGKWIGLKIHLRNLPLGADLEMHLGRHGYAGLTTVEDGRVNLCGLFRVDPSIKGRGIELIERYLARDHHHELIARCRASDPDTGSFTGTGGFSLGWQDAEPGICRIGDAAALIPPFTGNGMSMAFESAAAAIPPLQRWSEGRTEWERVAAEIESTLKARFHRRLAWSGNFQRILLHPLGSPALRLIGRCGPLPFRTLLALVR